MTRHIRPLQLGNLTLPNNIIYSPLAGCSDFPFRKMARRYGGPGLIYCEMVKMDALVRNDANTFHLLDYSGDMHPIGAQIVGSKPEIAGQAAQIIEQMGFDVVDLNCGCPVDKVTKDSSGSGMLLQPGRIGDVIAEMVAAVKIPVTVKIRAGWDDDSIVAAEITRIAEQAGAVAIAIHGRTRKQAYRGLANRDYIKECVEAANTIKVLGNGDVFDPESAQHMFEHTGCDGILCSRGTMGAPWIGDDITRDDRGEVVAERSQAERRAALMNHFETMLSFMPARRVVIEMRRVGCWYFKKSERTREFRGAISKAQNVDEIRQLIATFPVGEKREPSPEVLCSAN